MELPWTVIDVSAAAERRSFSRSGIANSNAVLYEDVETEPSQPRDEVGWRTEGALRCTSWTLCWTEIFQWVLVQSEGVF